MASALLELREGDAGDLGEVMATMREAFDPAFGEAWTAAQCAGVLSMPGSALLLARIDDAPAGFALSRGVVDEVELLLLAVRPPLRRRRVASALLDRVMADAAVRRARRIHLEVRDGNDAILLYATAGFAPVGRRQAYYRGVEGKSFAALTYSRAIETT